MSAGASPFKIVSIYALGKLHMRCIQSVSGLPTVPLKQFYCLSDDDPFVLSPFTCNILKWADIQMAPLFRLPLSNVSNYGKMALAYNIDRNKSALTCQAACYI